MKKHLLLLLATFFAVAAQAQDITDKDKLVYLDSLGKETTNLNQVYYRIIKDYHTDAAEYKIFDYYKSGKIRSESSTRDKGTLRRIGKKTDYYENGNKASEEFINNDFRYEGPVSYWYENGKPKIVSEYEYQPYNRQKVQQVCRILSFWDENGEQKVINGNGHFKDGKTFIIEGDLVSGSKDGTWTGKSTKGKYAYTEIYSNGELLSGTSTDSDGKQYTYDQLEVKPGPKKGLPHFYKFLSERYRMPRKNTPGKIILTFIIDKDGSIDNIEILQSVSEKMDKEAIDVLKKYPDWQPGMQRGQVVKVQYSLPITIKSE